MSIYEKNLEILKECSIEPQERYQDINEIKVGDLVQEIEGQLYYVRDDVLVQLTSIEIEKEVALYTKKLDWKKENLIFVLGLANIELIKKILKKKNRGTKIVIYEPNEQIFKYILDTVDLTEVFSAGDVLVWWNNGREKYFRDFGADIYTLNWTKLVHNIEVILSPAYSNYLSDFKKVFNSVKNKIEQYYTTLGNSLEDVLKGFRQNGMNFISCLETNSLKELEEKYKDIPAIIVSAGPSLEKNIDILKDAQNKALIISCDASWKACKQHGVKPDAIASIERDIETYQYYYEGVTFDKDLVLVAPSLLWPQTLVDFKGKKVLMSKNDEGVEGWWSRHFPNLEFLNQGMSCANVAYAVAEYAGCNPIILIGQDLAYTNNKKHSDFTHTEYEGENNAGDAEILMVEDINGEMIATDRTYNTFRLWFEDVARSSRDVQMIDATEGGAKIQGSTIMTLKEAIDTYCTKEKKYSMYELLEDRKITAAEVIEKKEEVLKSIDSMIHKLYKTKKKTEEHYRTLEKLYNRIDDGMTENQLINVVKKMQKGDQIINYMVGQRDTITFFQQYIAQTIAYVKALGNDLTPVNVLKNLYVQGNLIGAVKRACVVLIDECEKLKDIVTDECDKYCEDKGEKHGTGNL